MTHYPNDILIRPAFVYAFLRTLPVTVLALAFLLLAWFLSPSFILFSIAACGTAWYRLLYIRCYRYLVTPEFITIRRGIFFKRTDQVELFRVKDYIITRPFLFQLFGLMNLILKSTDLENSTLVMNGIPCSDITDTIRERVQQARQRNHIVELN